MAYSKTLEKDKRELQTSALQQTDAIVSIDLSILLQPLTHGHQCYSVLSMNAVYTLYAVILIDDLYNTEIFFLKVIKATCNDMRNIYIFHVLHLSSKSSRLNNSLLF